MKIINEFKKNGKVVAFLAEVNNNKWFVGVANSKEEFEGWNFDNEACAIAFFTDVRFGLTF